MKRSNVMLLLVVAIPIGVGGFWLVNTSRAATETPEYQVVRADGKFEIRDYPALTVVTTAMDGDGMNGGFRQLFRFITGNNEGGEKIAMTSPVLIDNTRERKTMSFILPAQTVAKGVPKPSGSNVELGSVPAARYAVLRFRGGRTSANEATAIEELKAWLAAEKIPAKSAPLFGYYDPPWTPTFLRRNEVMMRIDSAQDRSP